MGIRRNRSGAPELYLVRENPAVRALREIHARMETCPLQDLLYDVHIVSRQGKAPRIFIRYAFDRLPDECRFGPAARAIRQTLLQIRRMTPARNGIDLQYGNYQVCIGAVHSSMLD